MQFLCSPTRAEVDEAHSKGHWLHIGVLSIRNLSVISVERMFLWLLLGLSALPLHFVYNSAIFMSTQANEYAVMGVPETFLHGQLFDNGSHVFEDATDKAIAESIRRQIHWSERFENLTASKCFSEYTTQYVSGRGDVLLVSNSTHFLEKQFHSSPHSYPSWAWRHWFSSPTDWIPYDFDILYCWSEKVDEQCKLNFSLAIALIVITCNITTVICMIFTVWRRRDSALVTLGDAIESFLETPDSSTRGLCIFSSDVMKLLWTWKDIEDLLIGFGTTRADFLEDPKISKWKPKCRYWAGSVTSGRWLLSYTLYAVALGGGAIALVILLTDSDDSLTLRNMGQPIGNNILAMNRSLLISVVIANTPQTILSYLYVLFNSIFTFMLTDKEWMNFARHRKPLRVSSPKGFQRSTYFLQLPFKYSIPLVVFSATLSWLASQSLFLVQIDILDEQRLLSSESILSCGYTPMAILLSMVVGSIVPLSALLTGLRKHHPDMPLAGTTSIAISAACHAPPDDVDAAVLPIQWGVVSVENGVGHCCFSSKLVTPPIPNRRYLGSKNDFHQRFGEMEVSMATSNRI